MNRNLVFKNVLTDDCLFHTNSSRSNSDNLFAPLPYPSHFRVTPEHPFKQKPNATHCIFGLLCLILFIGTGCGNQSSEPSVKTKQKSQALFIDNTVKTNIEEDLFIADNLFNNKIFIWSRECYERCSGRYGKF